MKIKTIITENNLQGDELGRTIKIIEADEINNNHPSYGREIVGDGGSGYATITEEKYCGKLSVGYRRNYGCRK